jgi:predicted nucleic acid-binding protein
MPRQHVASANAGIVVCNTTPLICLAGLGRVDLLESLYKVVTIPEQVRDEYDAGRPSNDPAINTFAWLNVVSVPTLLQVLPVALGVGEKAAITLALSQPTRAILLDELHARRIAQQQGLPVTGTLGTLLAAKQRGLVPLVRPLLVEMIRQKRRLSPKLYAQILAAAGEGVP